MPGWSTLGIIRGLMGAQVHFAGPVESAVWVARAAVAVASACFCHTPGERGRACATVSWQRQPDL